MKKSEKSSPRYKKATSYILVFAALVASAYLAKTFPYNFAGKIAYRLMGKPFPTRQSEDLAHIRQFLYAKRMIDRRDYRKARKTLEELRPKVSSNFIFFREAYLYLGYVYDVTGEFGKEESLYQRLDNQNPAFSRFLLALYFIKSNRPQVGRGLMQEALQSDDKSGGLGNRYRPVAVRVLREMSADAGKQDLPRKNLPQRHLVHDFINSIAY